MADPKLEFEISGNLTVDAIYMPEGIRIGDVSSGEVNQDNTAIAIGLNAGFQDQSNNAIAIGMKAGNSNQAKRSIAIGEEAGFSNQEKLSVAIGRSAGKDNQKEGAVALGYDTGKENQGLKAIAIGFGAGRKDQSNNSIAIGNNAGKDNLGDKSIAIGYEAEIDNSSANVTQNVIVLNATDSSLNSDVSSALFIKPLRDVSNVSTPVGRTRNDYKIMVYESSSGEVAYDASYNGTGSGGGRGGTPAPPPNSVQFNDEGSFGGNSNFTYDKLSNLLELSGTLVMPQGVAIGNFSTHTNNPSSIAIGIGTGFSNQGSNAIAIGEIAGVFNQKDNTIAIGYGAGRVDQSNNAIAIGTAAGQSLQSEYSIAIGNNAGKDNLGDKSIAIGYEAEIDNSSSNITQNVIVLNATDSSLNSDVSSAFFVKPLRDLSNNGSRANFRVMIYDETRGEIGFDSSYNGTGSGGGTTFPGAPLNSVQFNNGVSFGGDIDFRFMPVTNQLDLSNGVITMPAGIRIGDVSSGEINQSSNAIAIGLAAGNKDQSSNAIAIGPESGYNNQGSYGIAIGVLAGRDNQREKAIAIGENAGQDNQDKLTLAIGRSAGKDNQKEGAVGLGYKAGEENQGVKAIAIGFGAGRIDQSNNSIAIGNNAGKENLGDKSIAIGFEAEIDNSSANITQNVIVLNATDSSLNSDVSSAFFVKPLRDVSNVSTPVGRTRNDYKIMVYDSSSGEIAYDTSYNGTSNIDLTNVNAVSVSSDNVSSKNVSSETITVSESLFLGSITYEDASLSQVSGTPTQITLNTPVILFDISNISNNYYTDISNQGQTGQTLDIFMETNGGTVQVDFGINTLVTAGGIFRYLTFNSMGQSASLIYIGSKWRIRNSGALPSVS